jgi:hypothetical protein
MIKFSELVGTYWVDLIEQVVPSTTIWGSTYVYGNTFWDQQKFEYKKYSLFTCNLPVICGDALSPTTGFTSNVGVNVETLPNDSYYDSISGSTTGETFANIKYTRLNNNDGDYNNETCDSVGIIQMNVGSEFFGSIIDYNNPHSCQPSSTGTTSGDTGPDSGDTVITECSISVEIVNLIENGGGYSATAQISGDITGPVSYLWSNGETTQTAINLSVGQTYTVTAIDNGIEGCQSTSNITTPEPTLSIGDCAHGGFVFYLDGNGGGLVAAINDATGTTTNSCNIYLYRGDFNISVPQNITGPNIGDGQQNTDNLINLFPSSPLDTYAAGLAGSYVNTDGACGGVFNDWYLPSSDELETMRINLSSVGSLDVDFNFANSFAQAGCDGINYWSSTINLGIENANTMLFPFGGPYLLNQNTEFAFVRAIRSF